MKNKEYWISWSKAAGIRAVKTVAETAISMIGANAINIVSLNWLNIAGVCATAGIRSLFGRFKRQPGGKKAGYTEEKKNA